MKNKLLIWDFDGVISDTEFVWVDVWKQHIKDVHGIEMTIEEAFKHISGVGTAIKVERLKNLYGINIDDKEHDLILEKELEAVKGKITLTNGILNIFNSLKNQCLGTGSTYINAVTKVKALGIDNFFKKENTFTIDNVKLGKPHPDLFLYAAKKMGFEPKECVVVDDAIAGCDSAIRAGMDIIAFVEHHHKNRDEIIEKITALGVKKIAYNMEDVKSFLNI